MRPFSGFVFVIAFLASCDPTAVSQQEDARAQPTGPLSTLVITSDSGRHLFSVEVADEPNEQRRGLMYRRELGPDRGMLFVYGSERRITMWMRNTYISLDMIFIASDGRIRNIAADTEPLSDNIVASEGQVHAVLEVPAGTAARLGIRPGDFVSHSRL